MLRHDSHTPLFRDPSAAIDDRIEDLLDRMTLAEKIGQMMQLDARLDIEPIVLERQAGSILHASPETMLRARELVETTRLRIPLLTADDCIHGHSFWPGATIYPSQLAMACAWDADLARRVARATAVEVSATGIHWTFSPVLCIARDLRWGRVDETFGEDPHLIGELASAMVAGYQGDGLDDPTAILACAKHFAGYSETQGGRDASEADLSRRKLRSWFLPPFERVAREGCRTFMLGYQSTDGVPIVANTWLLNEVLRGEWGYTGTLVTDWDNVGRMVWEQKIAADITDAAIRALNAGNDLVMTTPTFLEGATEAVESGQVHESVVDEAVRRILRVKFELGLFEDPRPPSPERQRAVIGCDEHRELALETARRSLVLLRNDGVLPLPTDAGPRRVAVIGPNADDQHAQLGDWAGSSGQVTWMPDGHPRELTETVLDGFRAVVPDGWQVTHARGCDIEVLRRHPLGDVLPDGQPLPKLFSSPPPDQAMLDEAVAAASEADVAVVVVGDTVHLHGEYRSTATLELQGGQRALLDAVAATGTPYVVVVVSSKPQVLPDSALGADALIWAFNPGMRGGRAVAELVLGAIEPSGRLPVSVPRHIGQTPLYYNQIRGQHGDSYVDLTQDPAFAFGEGMSYTTVEYADLAITTPRVGPDEVIHATVRLTNTGERPCLETVQVYVSDVVTSVTWADRELKSFVQVHLDAGESREVELTLPASACTLVDANGVRRVEPGEFELLVGPQSRRRALQAAAFAVA